ncbi:MAG: oligosaccharide flippase family protein [Pseudomonadales bacterium]|nr:oligosaccharide flippase family protein [Pseudomonadales bacterium]
MSLANRVAAGTSLLTMSNVVARMLSLVTMPILTSLLAPSAYGVAAIVVTLVALISCITIAGMDVSYVRSYQNASEYEPVRVERYVWRFVSGTTCIASLLAWVVWPQVSLYLELPNYLVYFVVLGVAANVIYTMVIVRARLSQRYSLVSIATLISAVSTAAVSIAIAFFWRQDEFALVVAMLVTWMVPLLVLRGPGGRTLQTPSGLSRDQRLAILSVGSATLLTAPAYWVMSSFDRWFLATYAGMESVGVYSVCYTVAIMGMLLNNAVLPVWTTEAVREVEKNDDAGQVELGRVADQILAVLLVVWLAVAAAGGDIVRLLAAPEYHAAVGIVPIISLAVMFHGVSHVAMSIFTVTNNVRLTIPWWLAGAALCVGLNALLIPEFGALGAATAQLVSFGTMAIGLVIHATRLYPFRLKVFRLFGFAALVGLSALGLNAPWSEVAWQSLLFKLPVGLGVAWLAAWWFGFDLRRIFQATA